MLLGRYVPRAPDGLLREDSTSPVPTVAGINAVQNSSNAFDGTCGDTALGLHVFLLVIEVVGLVLEVLVEGLRNEG